MTLSIDKREGNVIYLKKCATNPHNRSITGVFIKPAGCDMAMWSIKGNVSGFIASYIAFHPDFSPSLFGYQVRQEMQINDDDPPPLDAA